jgi:site-specific recombinase XerD
MINNTVSQRLADLLMHIDGAYSPNTLRAYKADMMEFIEYCNANDLPGLPATPETVAKFLMQTLQQGIKSSTIRRKVSSISAIHRLSYQEDPTKHPEVKITQRRIFRQLGTRFDQAYPITRRLLDKLFVECGTDLHGLRNRALLLIAYESMRRRSELVALRVEDIEWLENESASILLRRSKTDQLGNGKWIHLSKEATNAVKIWITAAGINSGFLLRGIRASGTVTESLCESRISRIYKHLARKANIQEQTVREISGHSMRVGAAHDLLNHGASLPQIMIRGGWAKTDTVMRYIERVRPS